MSVWHEIPRSRPDGRHKASERTTVRSAFQNFAKFFPDLSHIRTVLPCRLDDRTSIVLNFHIKASRVRTIGMVVRTIDLVHTIFIYVARASGP
jgi:hypothetical protein